MHRRILTVAFCLLAIALSGCHGSGRDIVVRDIEGRQQQPLAQADAPATVLIFITADCPISNSYAPEINRIVEQYSARRVAFYLVHVDDSLSASDAQTHAKEFGFACPVLLDPRHQLVAAAGATLTPEAAVVAPSGEILYRGRIDDRYVDFGKKRFEPSQRDLRAALDDILAGRGVRIARTRAVGCFIAGAS